MKNKIQIPKSKFQTNPKRVNGLEIWNLVFGAWNFSTRPLRSSRGSYLVLMAMMTIIFAGVGGVIFEMNKAMTLKSHMQHVADLAAMAAAREFTDKDGAVTLNEWYETVQGVINENKEWLGGGVSYALDRTSTGIMPVYFEKTGLRRGDDGVWRDYRFTYFTAPYDQKDLKMNSLVDSFRDMNAARVVIKANTSAVARMMGVLGLSGTIEAEAISQLCGDGSVSLYGTCTVPPMDGFCYYDVVVGDKSTGRCNDGDVALKCVDTGTGYRHGVILGSNFCTSWEENGNEGNSGGLLTCLVGADFYTLPVGDKQSVSCHAGDLALSCQDTATGSNHGTYITGNTCTTWEGNGNEGGSSGILTCLAGPDEGPGAYTRAVGDDSSESCAAGDLSVRCQDIGTGNNHGAYLSGNTCYAWEGGGNHGGSGAILSCIADVDVCPVPDCGNGTVEPSLNEQCDDGARVSGDGCSEICQCDGATPNFTDGHCCPEDQIWDDTANACRLACGNGTVERQLGEDCDDGGNISGDGCSGTCKCDGATPDFSDGHCCPLGQTWNGTACAAPASAVQCAAPPVIRVADYVKDPACNAGWTTCSYSCNQILCPEPQRTIVLDGPIGSVKQGEVTQLSGHIIGGWYPSPSAFGGGMTIKFYDSGYVPPVTDPPAGGWSSISAGGTFSVTYTAPAAPGIHRIYYQTWHSDAAHRQTVVTGYFDLLVDAEGGLDSAGNHCCPAGQKWNGTTCATPPGGTCRSALNGCTVPYWAACSIGNDPLDDSDIRGVRDLVGLFSANQCQSVLSNYCLANGYQHFIATSDGGQICPQDIYQSSYFQEHCTINGNRIVCRDTCYAIWSGTWECVD